MAGPPVEDLGSYNVTNKKVSLNAERARYWIGVGARPSDTLHTFS